MRETLPRDAAARARSIKPPNAPPRLGESCPATLIAPSPKVRVATESAPRGAAYTFFPGETRGAGLTLLACARCVAAAAAIHRGIFFPWNFLLDGERLQWIGRLRDRGNISFFVWTRSLRCRLEQSARLAAVAAHHVRRVA